MDKQVNWTGFLITLSSAVAVVIVWAFSTFVTIRERDQMKAAQDQRISTLETKYDTISIGLAEIKGQNNTVVLMMQQLSEREKRSHR